MAKLQINPEAMATFGEIFHYIDVFERLGFGKIIDSCLGKRAVGFAVAVALRTSTCLFPS